MFCEQLALILHARCIENDFPASRVETYTGMVMLNMANDYHYDFNVQEMVALLFTDSALGMYFDEYVTQYPNLIKGL